MGSPGQALNGSSDCEHPYGAAFRHLGEFAGPQRVQAALHRARINSPAGLDGDVLNAVDAEGRWLTDDAGTGGVLPQDFSALRVQRAELPIVGAAGKHKTAARCEDRSPVR